MTNALLERPQLTRALPDLQPGNDHRFFDPPTPVQPEHVLGVETDAVLRLGRAATALGALPPRVNLSLYALPDAVRILPLVEQMQAGAKITPEEVRPYRKPIKKLSLGVSFADKLAATAGAVAVGVPLRRALNRKIEQEFAGRAAEAIDKAREAVASIEHEVNHIASFENPRAQFVSELDDLARTVSTAITDQRDWRVRNNIAAKAEPETAKGIVGFFTKAVRSVKSFFGMFSRKPEINAEVTAYDAGAGIEKTFKTLITNPELTEKRLPMLSKLMLDRLPNTLPLTTNRLALVAPEILNFLFSTSSENREADKLIESINRNPHELRFVTRFKKHYGRYSLEGIQRASHTLMPAIRDVLPTSGDKVREIYTQAQELLQQKHINETFETPTEQPEVKRRSKWHRLKILLGKSPNKQA